MLSILAQESVLVLGPDSPGLLVSLVSSILPSVTIFKLWRKPKIAVSHYFQALAQAQNYAHAFTFRLCSELRRHNVHVPINTYCIICNNKPPILLPILTKLNLFLHLHVDVAHTFSFFTFKKTQVISYPSLYIKWYVSQKPASP